ncbi:AMP phosphorylase (plasmid) [Natrialba magadii ATCC 43099]|uniref:AMP phosphorylase n=1 Tax=Natrialba magadii (strain ATCC 43099 / DSM 3394 / CCM 3739 / CIP 104546 / IAM 13178 / JCM 8861 / NBRC 102185 / NCIMB 2190 / MS3) TaxID=547559 RepID=D3T1T7_NATMM|nr:AMP phosphorylase [Natrialba magadii]ADD07546.1 AMP phosphorylase [Natrialba magadii ATCC 43099]ELY26582.1 thymidine phosphorylase [Natrialba magadii ATCC 43099]
MRLEATTIDIGTSRPLVLLNTFDADELGAHPLDRVRIGWEGETTTGIVKRTDELVEPGIVGVTEPLHHVHGDVGITLAGTPPSVRCVRKKLDDVELGRAELERIVRDVHEHRLSDVELSAFVSAVYANGLSLAETKHLTEAMSGVGQRLQWDRPVVADKHSIGGVAGNCVTPIMVAIVTEAGVTMPKTSSRAVTSPAGTADVMEVLSDVEFSIDEIERIVTDTNGCLVWGGGVDLSPVDDEIIRAENPLSIDPEGLLMASVLSKKQSAGSTNVVIDIPYGEGAKVESLVAARELADDFKRVGDHLEMDVSCAITHGTDPIGRGIGPVLEARDVLAVLEGNGPDSLRLKSLRLAEMLLEHCGVDASATEILDSGKALEQFRTIVAAQGGDPDVESTDLEPGEESTTVRADRAGITSRVDNRQLSDLARRAGAPRDSGAGLVVHRTVGDEVELGDRLYTIHAETESKLEEAVSFADQLEPIRVRSKADALIERR